MTAADPLELVRLVRRIALDEAGAIGRRFSDGTVETYEAGYAAVRKGDPTASPTPGFFVPLEMRPLSAGDHVWVYDAGGFKFVDRVWNRNALIPADLELESVTLGGAVHRTEGAILRPPQITANVSNYAPDGGPDHYRWLLDFDGSYTVDGILAELGAEHELTNTTTTRTWTFNNDTTSAAANRILTPSATPYALAPQATARIFYDDVAARWRIV